MSNCELCWTVYLCFNRSYVTSILTYNFWNTAATDIKCVLLESFESAECFWKVLNKRVLINRNNTNLNAYLWLCLISMVMRFVDLPWLGRSVKYSLCLSVKLCVVIFIRSALFWFVFNYFGVDCVLIYMDRVAIDDLGHPTIPLKH